MNANMTTDELIDLAMLNVLTNHPDSILEFKEDKLETEKEKVEQREYLRLLVYNGLLLPVNKNGDLSTNEYRKTPFFNNVAAAGGWIRYNSEKRKTRNQIVVTIIVAAVGALGTLGQWLLQLNQELHKEQTKEELLNNRHQDSNCQKYFYPTNDTTHADTAIKKK